MGLNRTDWKRIGWTFVQAGLAAALVVLSAQSSLPADWSGWKQLGIAAGLAFVAAFLSAAKNFFLPDASALK